MSDKSISLPELAQWLADPQRPANTLSLDQLFGFLFAICCTPVRLEARDWMPAIFVDRLTEIDSSDPHL